MEAAAGRPVRAGTPRRRVYPLVGPDLRDPRLHVAAVVVSVQVLGQTLLHFDVSIAQILIAVGTCAALEFGITLSREQVLAWPASALLTGNGVAFVLRVPGTQHGDWWSVRGGWIFAATAAVSLLSKYLIRVGGRPLFNPSNFGLVLAFVLLGSRRVEPLDFWWVRPGIALTVALTVIVGGGVVLAWRVRMLGVIASFWLSYAAALGVLAARGHCITARWHIGPVCNQYFWTVLVVSPEVLVFMFFMITDPKTVPHGRTARIAYGAAIALVFVVLAAPQRTEFATKVALLGALLLVCAARPVLERILPTAGSEADKRASWFGIGPSLGRRAPMARPAVRRRRVQRVAFVALSALAYSAVVIGAGASTRTASITATVASLPKSCTDRASPSIAPARPNVTASPLPTVRVTNPNNVASTLNEQSAREIVRDAIDDLAIAAEAIEHRDPAVAGDIARSPWLESLTVTICATTGPLLVRTYRFDHATVTTTKRATGQVFPEIDLTLQGELHETTLTRSSPARQLAQHSQAFRNTFVVAKRGGLWLICGYRSDPRTANCVTAT